MGLFEQIEASAAYLRALFPEDFSPKVGLVLGTGAGAIAQQIEVLADIPYADIPHFMASTVQGHKGRLLVGYWSGVPLMVMCGRFHYYEGYSMQQVTFPIRVMKALGVEILIPTNASGSVNAEMTTGSLVLIKDHINFLPEHPLRGRNDERLGVRFPEMLMAYDQSLRIKTLELAGTFGMELHEGVYAALTGPSLETPAEYEMLHRIGADLVGMSTVPEVLVARHAGMRVLAISIVANLSYPTDAIEKASLEDIIAAVDAATPRLARLLGAILQDIAAAER